jgi:hypothetical protein
VFALRKKLGEKRGEFAPRELDWRRSAAAAEIGRFAVHAEFGQGFVHVLPR